MNMIFIGYELINKTKATIVYIHNNAEDLALELNKNIEELSNDGILVESIPTEPEELKGKRIIPYINPETKEIWYEYEDRPLTQEEELYELKHQLSITQNAIDFILMGGI